MSQEPIHFIITGGTIDSEYNGVLDTVTPREHSVIPTYMSNLKLDRPLEFTEICMKDSRTLSQADRQLLAESVAASSASKIVVTHGTYTLPDTARFLEATLGSTEKTVVLTGSMVPLDGFTMSDAGFNLGFAIAQLDLLDPGVYVSLNGRVFSPGEVVKLLDEGRFGSIFGESQ